ncbi:unnamed protein product, partial [Rotaria sp. Silwood2]
MNLFDTLLSLSLVDLAENYENLYKLIDFKFYIDHCLEIIQQWKLSGKNFLQLRKEQRLNNEYLTKIIGRNLSYIEQNFISKSTYDNDLNIRYLVEQIRKRMQWEQIGNEQIFTLSTCQMLLRKFFHFYHQYQLLINLKPLNENEIFHITHQVYFIDIEKLNLQLHSITMSIFNSNNKQTNLIIPLDLVDKYSRLILVVNTNIIKLIINTENSIGTDISWTKLVDQQQIHTWDNHLRIKCFPADRNECFYTVKGLGGSIDDNDILSINDLDGLINIFDEIFQQQINQKKEEFIWEKSSITLLFKLFIENLNKINQLFKCSPLSDIDLLTSSNIYQLFLKLPTLEIFKQVFDLLQIDNQLSIIIPLQIVNDDNSAINQQFNQIWTQNMEKTFQIGKNLIIDAQKRVSDILNSIRSTKS